MSDVDLQLFIKLTVDIASCIVRIGHKTASSNNHVYSLKSSVIEKDIYKENTKCKTLFVLNMTVVLLSMETSEPYLLTYSEALRNLTQIVWITFGSYQGLVFTETIY